MARGGQPPAPMRHWFSPVPHPHPQTGVPTPGHHHHAGVRPHRNQTAAMKGHASHHTTRTSGSKVVLGKKMPKLSGGVRKAMGRLY